MDINDLLTHQQYHDYTEEQHSVWSNVFVKRMEKLHDEGSGVFLKGVSSIGLESDRLPNLSEVNASLMKITGWESVAVPGYIMPKHFFQFLALRKFPTTITVRDRKNMDYVPEPDIIHDVLGHVPLHADNHFADFLQNYGLAAMCTNDPLHTERLSRLFWFTVEFGLISENNKIKLYGSGLISSQGEGHHALRSSKVEHRPFDLEKVCNTPFNIDTYQPILYVLEGFDQLSEAMCTYTSQIL